MLAIISSKGRELVWRREISQIREVLRTGRRPAGDFSSAGTRPDQGKDKLSPTDQCHLMPCPRVTYSHAVCVPCARKRCYTSLMLHGNGEEDEVVTIIYVMRNLRPRGQWGGGRVWTEAVTFQNAQWFSCRLCPLSYKSSFWDPRVEELDLRAASQCSGPQVHAMSLFVSVVSLPHSLD